MINGISQIVWEQWMENMCQLKNHHIQVHTTTATKIFFSILLMAVVNSKYEFIVADAGINGRISDGGVLGNKELGKTLVNKLLPIPEPGTLPNREKKLPFVFVGDNAFALTENFMKPYGQTGISAEQRIFNY
jgi:hypothetical protein